MRAPPRHQVMCGLHGPVRHRVDPASAAGRTPERRVPSDEEIPLPSLRDPLLDARRAAKYAWVAARSADGRRGMDPAIRRRALRMMSNGMYVMTSRSGERYGAATVTWVSQASFRPPLLMAAVRPESNVFACLRESGIAALHILGRGQVDVARRFFAPTRADDSGINGLAFHPGVTRAPIREDIPACVDFRVMMILD